MPITFRSVAALVLIAGASLAQQNPVNTERTVSVAVVVVRSEDGAVRRSEVLGSELSGASVSAVDRVRGSRRVLARGTTDDAGRVRLRASREALLDRQDPWGPFDIVVRHSKYATRVQPQSFGGITEVRLHARRTVAGVVQVVGNGVPTNVQVNLSGPGYRDTFMIDLKARFRWVDAPTGRLALSVNDPSYWMASMNVVAGSKDQLLTFRLEPLTRVTGQVVDREGRAVSGASLYAIHRVEAIRTDSDGRFAAALAMEGRSYGAQGYFSDQRSLFVSSPGYLIERYRILNPNGNRIVLTTRVAPLEIVLRDSAGGAIPGGRVELLDGSSLSPPLGRALSRLTDQTGRCVFAVRPAGQLALVARAKSFLPRYVEVAASSRGLEIKLTRGRKIRGRVVRDGVPVCGARVTVLAGVRRTSIENLLWPGGGKRLTSWHAVGSVVYSDPEGRFVVEGVPGHAKGVMASLPIPERSAFVSLADDVGDLVLGAPLAIEGRLVSDWIGPLSGVTVRCRSVVGDRTQEVVTDKGGAYRFRDVELGRYRLEADPKDHAPLRLSTWSGDRCDLSARSLVGDRELRIRLSGAESRPGEDATVVVSRQAYPRIRRRRELPNGQDFGFEKLLAGRYEISVLVPGYERAVRLIDVLPDGAVPFDCRILLTLGELTKVRMAPQARLSIETLRGRQARRSYVAGRDGIVLVGGLGPGAYRLVSRAAGYLTSVTDIDVASGAPVREPDMRVGKASMMRVFVGDARGQPIKDARLVIELDSGAEFETGVTTAADGVGSLDDLVAGEVVIRAVVGELEGTAVVIVKPDQKLEIRIRIASP